MFSTATSPATNPRRDHDGGGRSRAAKLALDRTSFHGGTPPHQRSSHLPSSMGVTGLSRLAANPPPGFRSADICSIRVRRANDWRIETTWRKIPIGARSAGTQITGQAAIAVNGSPGQLRWRGPDPPVGPPRRAPSATRATTPAAVHLGQQRGGRKRSGHGSPRGVREKQATGSWGLPAASLTLQTNAARCFSMNASSVIGGRPPIFSTRSFVPAKIPFW